MNIGGVIYESLNDGLGVRTVIFISGCRHNCKGCHNPRLFDFNYGVPFDSAMQNKIIEYVREHPLVQGITVSGGDPMYSSVALFSFLYRFRHELPGRDVWLYTGFKYENIAHEPVLRYVDVVVDGLYDETKRDISLPFRGSSNQRIIDVKTSRQLQYPVLLDLSKRLERK